tara:strand:+ start:192 stop:422 length:231 start_codon:yes stop_codon:yes gene_type:complete
MSNHLRNLRVLFESAKLLKMTRKVDNYEYESLEKDILQDKVVLSEVLELFTDKAYRDWFYPRNFAGHNFDITRFAE